MRLVAQSNESWRYHLDQKEADILLGLVRQFPFTEMGPVQISRTGKSPKNSEREKLLAESLAEHRKELKKLAVNLLGGNKWRKSGKDRWLTLDSGSREVLLQILNDIRVGSWHAVGEPEVTEILSTGKDPAHRHLMDLAAYFEMGLLESEDSPEDAYPL